MEVETKSRQWEKKEEAGLQRGGGEKDKYDRNRKLVNSTMMSGTILVLGIGQ